MKVNLKTNLSFLLILLGVISLAFIEGVFLSKAIIGEKTIQGGEIQLISFILISIFMITISTLKPDKLLLVSYSSMTLGLIVISGALFDQSLSLSWSLKVTELVLGGILIISGFFMGSDLKLNENEREMINEGIKNYRKKS